MRQMLLIMQILGYLKTLMGIFNAVPSTDPFEVMEKATNVFNGRRFISVAPLMEGKGESDVESKFITWSNFEEIAASLSKYLIKELENGTYFAYPPINVVGTETMARKKSAAKKAKVAELKKEKELQQTTKPIVESEAQSKKRSIEKVEPESDGSDSEEDDEESSTSEDEDDYGELLTEDVEEGINKVLNAIKTGDKSLFDSKVTFFKESDQDGAQKSKKEKPMYLKDYHRKNLLDGHAFEDEDGEERDWEGDEKPYALQQKEDKDKLLEAFKTSEANADGDDNDDDDDFLVKKEKPANLEEDEEHAQDPALPDPQLDGEKFLEQFMDKQAWIPKNDSKKIRLEEDDEEFDDALP
ncbi:unnamed protein product [Ambrosiozyma monospora]|uniref:Unnamed protein product n=1 Tax=Ambrosiozyma monospora TaxID=43982 RepID=A0ACB5SUX6_AMBMO|nr:unnamed protein product [Ambrosiozyma monospora]